MSEENHKKTHNQIIASNIRDIYYYGKESGDIFRIYMWLCNWNIIRI